MSKKVLNYAGKRPMLFAILVMATFTLGLLFSGWVTPTPGRAQPSQSNPQPSQENTNCAVTSVDTNCVSGGSVALVAPTHAPVVCIGDTVSVTADVQITDSQSQTITHYDQCPDDVVDSTAVPSYGVTWSMSGVTADVTSGTGLTASFTPTSCGNGTVSFSLAYTNTTPCSGTGSSSTSGEFKVVAVDSLTPDIPSGQGGLETGSEPPTYWVCPCAGDITVTASSCPGLTADQLPGCWSFTGGTEIDKLHHKVKKTDLMNGPVTFTVTCGTSTKTVILKTDPAKINYFTVFPSGSCLCDNFSGPSSYDNCGNNLAIDCVDCICGFGANGHFSYRYNGISVGVCRYSGANNVFLYKTTKHNCRILCTWHLTQEPATPTRWTVTKYDCMAGASSVVSRTASTWNSNWARPADELINSGYPANSCENQGTVTTTIHPTWQ